MIDFEKELQEIIENDPLNLLEIRQAPAPITADERLVGSFREINTFVQKEGREPAESRDIHERRLWSRLNGLREDPAKAAALCEHDEHGLLVDVPLLEDMETPGDILEHDPLGLLGGEEQDPNEIFKLRNVPDKINSADHVSRRKPCKNFEDYEPLFRQCHADLQAGAKVMRRFSSEKEIQPGRFFVLNGQLVYVETVGEKERKGEKINARTHCIFESGTESNMLLRSLSTPLSKDPTGRVVLDATAAASSDGTDIGSEDESMGYVYVLRSLSDDERISQIENLYKIGFSTQPVGQRIGNAAMEPTYLMSDVAIVSEAEVFNVNPQKLEHLMHTFFANACLNIDIYDSQGKRHTPREWFVVPLSVIESALEKIVDGSIVDYVYDPETEQIVGN